MRVALLKGQGKLVGLADLEVWISGVKLVINGISIRRGAGDELTISVPHFRHQRTGVPTPAITLRDELGNAMGMAIRKCLRDQGVQVSDPGAPGNYWRVPLRQPTRRAG